MLIVEGAGVAVIVRFADARVHLDILAVTQWRKGLVPLGIERHLGACLWRHFEEEAFAFPGNGRRLDYASAQDLSLIHI